MGTGKTRPGPFHASALSFHPCLRVGLLVKDGGGQAALQARQVAIAELPGKACSAKGGVKVGLIGLTGCSDENWHAAAPLNSPAKPAGGAAMSVGRYPRGLQVRMWMWS